MPGRYPAKLPKRARRRSWARLFSTKHGFQPALGGSNPPMIAGAILAASLELTPTQSAQIDAVVEQVMQANHIAGLSVGVGRQGSVLLLRGYGIRDVHAYAFADGDTIYR